MLLEIFTNKILNTEASTSGNLRFKVSVTFIHTFSIAYVSCIASKGRLYAILKTTGREGRIKRRTEGKQGQKKFRPVPEAAANHASCLTRGCAMEMRP
jgi:hypothetical protein